MLAVPALAREPATAGLSFTTAVRNGLLGIVVPVTQPASAVTRRKAANSLAAVSAPLEFAQNVVAPFTEATRRLRQAQMPQPLARKRILLIARNWKPRHMLQLQSKKPRYYSKLIVCYR